MLIQECCMLHRLEQWIDKTNLDHKDQRISCSKFYNEFKGFYPLEFLENSYFVVVDSIPKPNFPELRQLGLGDFIDIEGNGITYKNTYYIQSYLVSALRLHFHELVHVAQWDHLGAIPFIERYITEIQTLGYDESPLEKMAYGLDDHFMTGGEKVDVPTYVAKRLGSPLD